MVTESLPPAASSAPIRLVSSPETSDRSASASAAVPVLMAFDVVFDVVEPKSPPRIERFEVRLYQVNAASEKSDVIPLNPIIFLNHLDQKWSAWK